MATPHKHPLLSLPLLLPLLLFSPCPTHAQPSSSSQPAPINDFNDINTEFSATTIVMIIILLTVFFFTGMFFIYIRKRQNSTSSNDNTMARSRRIRASGLDPVVIESFPLMVYSDVKGLKMGNLALECAVCLCEFEDEENLTMLPKCSHAFHPNCIGMWLASHTTCPVCRDNLSDLVPGEPAGTSTGGGGGEAEREDQVVIRVDDGGEQDVAAELGRVGSVRDRLMRSWRSWSARAAVGGSRRMKGNKVWGEEERERFTLRLPENVRKELMQSGSSLRRSATVAAFRFNTGEESLRMGYREGTSFRMGRAVRAARSDRWASLRLPSSSFKAGVVGPLDCLGGAGRKVDGTSGDDGDDMSTVALIRH